jgi:hypothetical protein
MSEQYSDDRALDAGVVYPILEMRFKHDDEQGIFGVIPTYC